MSPWLNPTYGIDSNLVTRDITYENLTVTGFYRGVLVPRAGTSTIVGGRYQNYEDFQILTGINADRIVNFIGNLQFGRINMDSYYTYPAGNTNFIFLQDRVFLNFGPYVNRRVYYGVQAPNAKPFTEAVLGLNPSYVGLTSQELWNVYHVAVGGTLAPAGTSTVPWLIGLLGPAT